MTFRIFMCFTFILHSLLSYTQQVKTGDSLLISFIPKQKTTVSEYEDLIYRINCTNIAKRVVRVYEDLKSDRQNSLFGNYDILLYVATDTGYARLEHYGSSAIGYYLDSLYPIYGSKSPEVLARFDFVKQALKPNKTKKYAYNVLREYGVLKAGSYKFKVVLRTGHENKNYKPGIPVKVFYVESDWYYFDLQKELISPTLVPTTDSLRF
jgi:hypothetical protein